MTTWLNASIQMQFRVIDGLSVRFASLFAAARHPGRLRSLVVGSGGAAVPLQLGSLLKDWVETPDLDSFRRADPRQMVASALTGLKRHALPDSVRENTCRPTPAVTSRYTSSSPPSSSRQASCPAAG